VPGHTRDDDCAASQRQLCAGGIVFDEAGRLLVVQRAHEPAKGRWSVPGGRCLPDEPAALACVREVAEETGLQVRVVRFAGRVERAGPGAVRYDIDDFVCTVIGFGTITLRRKMQTTVPSWL
jgi:8-oxo-dGTP diphosphatase